VASERTQCAYSTIAGVTARSSAAPAASRSSSRRIRASRNVKATAPVVPARESIFHPTTESVTHPSAARRRG
jgi:hypothetical protein